MKIERLMYILVTLLSKKHLKASEIAEMYQVSVRTIYRDIDTLSLAGIPIYSKKGTEGGFYIDEDYKLNSLLFSDMEKKLIYELSSGLATSYQHPKIEELSQKMNYLVQNTQSESPYFFDLTLWRTNQLFLDTIEEGIEKSQVLAFQYTDFSGETTERIVEPINLVNKSNVWYVYAFCQLRQANRLFRISRIRRAVLLDEKFDSGKHDSFKKKDLDFFYSNLSKQIEIVSVSLEFSLEVKAKVYDSFLEKDILELSDKLIVEKDLPKEKWLIEMLLGFGGAVKVLSPLWLKEDIIQEAKNILNQYDIM